jgi:ATP-dependent 26S proteasome regulatory subunit
MFAGYAATAASAWATRDWDDRGPLNLHAPPLTAPLPGAIDLNEVLERTFPDRTKSDQFRIVGAVVDGTPYYAVYDVDEDLYVYTAEVIDGSGREVNDADLIKRLGAWSWVGKVKSPAELVWAGAFIAVFSGFGALYYGRARPGAPTTLSDKDKWRSTAGLAGLAATPVVGWIALAAIKNVSRERKRRAVMQASLGWTGLLLVLVTIDDTTKFDALSVFVVVMVALAYLWSIGGGRLLLAPEGFGDPEDRLEAAAARRRPRKPKEEPARPAGSRPSAAGVPSPPVPTPTPSPPPAESLPFDVERPDTLPSFKQVGGMAALKEELKSTIGLMLAFEQEADVYRITWNGLLLHGPPGVGKTFIARAVAGEFGLNLIRVSAGELVSAFRGESSRNVDDCFRFAATKIPCLLFFDEFDAVAQNRQDWPDAEARRTVGQLLQALEEFRSVGELIVMAATNHLEDLDPAVIRPGRFDRHVRVDLPDAEARQAIFNACLNDRPQAGSVDLAELARKSAGMTPAAIAQTVELAALDAFRDAAARGHVVQLTQRRLETALSSRGGKDRPLVEDWTWESLILPEDAKAELQELQYVIEDPEMARQLGVEPPTGVLLTGPPGTGKTTIAKVLAAQAKCSFYPVSAGDITSMWLGESERNIQRLFERARENRPSIIFIDEIDAIASRRGDYGSYDRQINELLQEMDGISGQQGIFVLAATNRPDQLDPAVLRGGRLSRTIEIPAPGPAGRMGLLRLFTKKMPLFGVNLDAVVAATEGASGADLRALCQQAGLCALVRARREKIKTPVVIAADFDEALADRAESLAARHGGREAGGGG